MLSPDPFASAPPWFRWALAEVGTRELPENTGPAIRRYISLAHCGTEGDPWCAIFNQRGPGVLRDPRDPKPFEPVLPMGAERGRQRQDAALL